MMPSDGITWAYVDLQLIWSFGIWYLGNVYRNTKNTKYGSPGYVLNFDSWNHSHISQDTMS